MSQHVEQRQKLDRQVIERATEDQDFRERFTTDPKGTLEAEYGIQIPEGANIQVLEESVGTHYFVLPADPAAELTDEQLEAVAGGWYVNLLWSSICFGSGDGGPDNADLSVSAS